MKTTNFSIPYADFSFENNFHKKELVDTFVRVLDSGRYITGPETFHFEIEFASYVNSNFAVGISNGTCSLKLALESLNFPKNSEVITVPNSFIASTSSIALTGLKPRFVDINEDMNIDIDQIESAINSNTRAIMPVHLTGRPARMKEISLIAEKYGLKVIEDAAQAIGAKINGRPVGSFGDFASFSFHPLKNLRAFGDAGMLTTKDKILSNRINQLKNHGLRDRSNCDFFSGNCRLDELQAALLRVQLRELDNMTELRRNIAFQYNDQLGDVVGVPHENPGEFHVYQTYMIRTSRRNDLQEFLKNSGIESLVHYPKPIHLQDSSAYLHYKKGDFPLTEKVADEILSLPIYPGLTEENQDFIIQKIKDFHSK